MPKSLYLINPRPSHPSYFGAEVFEQTGYARAQAIADLATVTVAALAPADWEVRVCEEGVETIDFDSDADYVGLTGKVIQGQRMVEVADAFRARGKTVLIGGPHASLSPGAVRDHCDVLLIGELEAIADELFADLERSCWKPEYVGDKPSLETSPLPRFELYPNDRALSGCVQTSRGCPFECEFCDVIQYLGRNQRHKTVEQIIAELDALYALGFRAIFLADDNFTVYRKRAKNLLAGLRDWNQSRPDGPVAFHTQVSIDAARDLEIMRLCGEAGLTRVFIGIETPNVESLKETGKRQNVGIDLVEQIEVFLAHGISVTGGMIVGFDHDGPDIFQRQLEFAMATPIPIFTLGALVAPAATPLFERMKASGRLIETGSETQGVWNTNILPTSMSRGELFAGLKWLGNNLYSPSNFAQRVVRMIATMGPQLGPFKTGYTPHKARPVETEAGAVIRKLFRRGEAERQMWATISKALADKPEAGPMVMNSLFSYAQVRCLYETDHYWEPEMAGAALAPPPLVAAQGLATLPRADAKQLL
ncbi:MAG: B12-binding domain-containing radical SAM protein [Thermoanaerobaculia bacterium]|nr:B12-binding domain-containing radical SAM protein [Thermoanaerobaculia bacterium]